MAQAGYPPEKRGKSCIEQRKENGKNSVMILGDCNINLVVVTVLLAISWP